MPVTRLVNVVGATDSVADRKTLDKDHHVMISDVYANRYEDIGL